jgi:hypothetical protein
MSAHMLVELALRETEATAITLRTVANSYGLLPAAGWFFPPDVDAPLFRRRGLSRELIESIAAYPERTREWWTELVRLITRGDSEGLEDLHGLVERVLDLRIGALSAAYILENAVAFFHEGDGSVSQGLHKAVLDLTSLREAILDGWTTLEGLQLLLAKSIKPSKERLARYAKNHPAPAGWLASEEKLY